MSRAVLEGITFGLCDSLDLVREAPGERATPAGGIQEIRAHGRRGEEPVLAADDGRRLRRPGRA